MISNPFVIAMTLTVAALLVCEGRGLRAGVWLAKPLAALTFVTASLAAGALATVFGRVMLAGFLLCAAGDVLLIPRTRGAFLGGLASFLLGHVAYGAAFAVRGIDPGATALAGAVLALGAVLIGSWLLPHVQPRMQAPVVVYMLVITTMVALAAGTFAARGNPWLLAGAVGFYLSDLAVARDRFIAHGFANRAWGLPLYFYAQLALASTVAPVVR